MFFKTQYGWKIANSTYSFLNVFISMFLFRTSLAPPLVLEEPEANRFLCLFSSEIFPRSCCEATCFPYLGLVLTG